MAIDSFRLVVHVTSIPRSSKEYTDCLQGGQVTVYVCLPYMLTQMQQLNPNAHHEPKEPPLPTNAHVSFTVDVSYQQSRVYRNRSCPHFLDEEGVPAG